MTEHDKLKLDQSMHYCKGNLEKGCDHKTNCKCKPIIIGDMDGNETNTRKFRLDVYEKVNGEFRPVRVECEFGNAKGKGKKRGARAMLEILR